MMVLLVCGQDIRALSLGLARNGALERDVVLAASPEQYLARVVETMAEWKVGVSDLGAIAVVTGPGSFTSSRVSTTIANALAFAANLPVVPVENPERLDLRRLAERLDLAGLPDANRFAVPTYDRPPHITAPTLKNAY